jgi:hypothetical protein
MQNCKIFIWSRRSYFCLLAPDACIPDEIQPATVIEDKLTSDDGTAWDDVAKINSLERQRNLHVAEGRPFYEVVACIDGRGSGNGVRICGRCC